MAGEIVATPTNAEARFEGTTLLSVPGAGFVTSSLPTPVRLRTASGEMRARFRLRVDGGRFFYVVLRRIQDASPRPVLYGYFQLRPDGTEQRDRVITSSPVDVLPAGDYQLISLTDATRAEIALELPDLTGKADFTGYATPLPVEWTVRGREFSQKLERTYWSGGAASLHQTGFVYTRLRADFGDTAVLRGEACQFDAPASTQGSGDYDVGCAGGTRVYSYPQDKPSLLEGGTLAIGSTVFEASAGRYGWGGNFSIQSAPEIETVVAAIPYPVAEAGEARPVPTSEPARPRALVVRRAPRVHRGKLRIQLTCEAQTTCRGRIAVCGIRPRRVDVEAGGSKEFAQRLSMRLRRRLKRRTSIDCWLVVRSLADGDFGPERVQRHRVRLRAR